MTQPAELLLINGRFYTVEAARPWAEAVAVAGSTITAVGTNEAILARRGPDSQVRDLGGRLALPGLCDAHIHFYDWSLARQTVPLADCASKAEMLNRVARWDGPTPHGDWLTGRGWNERHWPGGQRPTRHELDAACGADRPAIFWRSDMHCAVANSAALRAAGIDAQTPDPDGGTIGRDAAGQPNGLLWELAINQVMAAMPKPAAAELEPAFEAGMAELHRLGITAIHDQRMKDQSEGPLALNAYLRLDARDVLRLRVNCNVAAHDLDHLVGLGLAGGFGNERVRLGHVKLFADGTMGSETAWMLAPFVSGRQGMRVTPLEQLAGEVSRAAALGFASSIHAIGDRAVREVLDVFEELSHSGSQLRQPHRVEHVQIIDPADRPRLGALGLTASVQPVHIVDDMETAETVLAERAERLYNFRSLLDEGALLALGSDAPVATPDPFVGFHAAMYRQHPRQMAAGPWYPRQRLSLAETIHGYTLGAARAGGWQDLIGSLTAGKRADLIVLDRNLFEVVAGSVEGEEVAGTQVVLTVFDGQVVYDAGQVVG
ncbi:MAG: amidohydrolase [Candidatus Promineifilaceae bacterium]|nr:amidohydrolase [Candidatus Promineifilaceae bacterium]